MKFEWHTCINKKYGENEKRVFVYVASHSSFHMLLVRERRLLSGFPEADILLTINIKACGVSGFPCAVLEQTLIFSTILNPYRCDVDMTNDISVYVRVLADEKPLDKEKRVEGEKNTEKETDFK